MKVFAINETEWVAAESQAEALEYEGYELSEIDSISEIPESEWDEDVEYIPNDSGDDKVEHTTIRQMIELNDSFPCKIMTEMD